MKICNINSIVFSGKIIDSHVHLGEFNGHSYNMDSLDVFIKNPLSNNDTIEYAIVSSLTCINHGADEIEGNRQMVLFAKKNPKLIPLAVAQPKNGSVENIKKLFKENKDIFKGIKFHPDLEKLVASDEKYDKYLKFAQENKLPCLFHCGINYKPKSPDFVGKEFWYSAPEEIYKAAKKIPDTPVILAHLGAGGEKVHNKAVKVLLNSIENNDAKLYADISWVDCDTIDKPNIINVIKKLQNTSQGDKTDRLLFGTDAPIAEFRTGKNGLSGKDYYEKTIIDIKNSIKENFKNADELIDKIFYKNAKNLFLNKSVSTSTETVAKKSLSKNKIGIIIGTVLTAIAGGVFCYKDKSKKTNSTK